MTRRRRDRVLEGQLPLVVPSPQVFPSLRKRSKRAAGTGRRWGRTSLGITVPVPTDDRGAELVMDTMQVLQRTDGLHAVHDRAAPLGEGSIFVSELGGRDGRREATIWMVAEAKRRGRRAA